MKLIEEERNTIAETERKGEAPRREIKYESIKWRTLELG